MSRYNIDIFKLKGNESGERLDLYKSFNFILKDMSYDDFRHFAKLSFITNYPDSLDNYTFNYIYRIDRKHDNKETRLDYIKYIMYKLIQNLDDERVKLFV